MSGRRADLREAAELLGLSTEAVRKRASRGSIRSERHDGRVVVWVDDDRTGTGHGDELVDELRDRLRYVEGQLDLERQAHAEARQIIMQQSVTMRQLSASESPEEPVEAEADPGRVGDRDHTTSPETGAQRRPWWRRWLG